jgi:fructose-1,6-bisphosphatase
MADNFFTSQLNSGAARKAAAVTPSDTLDLPNFAVRGLFVGTAQTSLTIDPVDGVGNVALGAIAAGTVIPIQVRRVRATGTSPGTGIVALY